MSIATTPARPGDLVPPPGLRLPPHDRLPVIEPARIEWLDGTVETFASFWDAWNSVEDRFSVTSDGRIFSRDGFELGQVVS